LIADKTPRFSKRWQRIWLPTLAVLLAFGVAAWRLDQDWMWEDESWSMWAILAPLPETLKRVAQDVHPPLYFVALNAWVRLAGKSTFAVRMLSIIFGAPGLAVTYVIGKQLFDKWTAIAATLLLGTTSFFVYYARETRMYTLLMSLAAFSTWAYLRWLRRPTTIRLIAYSATIAALPYTHYCGSLITLAQGLHLLLTRPRRWGGWLLAGGLGLLIYAPWLPALPQQIQMHPNGPLVLPTPTNWHTVTWLLKALSGGAGAVVLAPYLLGKALPRLRRYGDAVLLLVLWALLTPLVVLSMNAWKPHTYEPRYVIGVLPAVALLIAYGIRHAAWKPLAVIALIGIVGTNLVAYRWFWPPRTPWGLANAGQAVETRRSGEPTLVAIVEPYGLESHYDKHLKLRNADAVDLSGRRHSPAEIRAIVATLDAEPAIWVMMPNNLAETWAAVAALDTHRHVGYRNNAAHLLFYRFDRGDYDDLTFSFDDKLCYGGELFAGSPVVQSGEQLCVEVTLTAESALDGSYSYGVHLVDVSNTLVAQHDEGLNTRSAGERITLAPCLKIPPDLPPGDYYLHLVVYTWADGKRLPLLEGGAGVPWGDALVFDTVTIE
jgi:hypothetical protein